MAEGRKKGCRTWGFNIEIIKKNCSRTSTGYAMNNHSIHKDLPDPCRDCFPENDSAQLEDISVRQGTEVPEAIRVGSAEFGNGGD
ncbi:MAG: hypothetical protein ACOC3A_07315, partial [Thermodesulfobacteriota bacterium]